MFPNRNRHDKETLFIYIKIMNCTRKYNTIITYTNGIGHKAFTLENAQSNICRNIGMEDIKVHI
jgi:hypothetical protein